MNDLLSSISEYVKSEEQDMLTIWQQIVLTALRKHRTAKRAATMLKKDEQAVRMVIFRMKKRGIVV